MASDGDDLHLPAEDDLLPDGRRAIAERLEELEDEESQLTVGEVADELGISLEQGPCPGRRRNSGPI